MASLISDEGSRWRVFFVHPQLPRAKARKCMRLPKMSRAEAEAFVRHVEAIIGQMLTGERSEKTSRWLAGLDDRTHRKLAGVGLVTPRESTAATLGDFLERYFREVPVKDSTRTTYLQTKRTLLEYFTAAKPIRGITGGDADAWRTWLRDHQKLAQATISKRVKTARQAFKQAIRWGLVDANPFEGVRAGSQANAARQRFIGPADVQAVLQACPSAEWRVIVALSRYGGLRCPSEVLVLRWSDVLWDIGRIRVTEVKTDGMGGHGERFVPIFPELRPWLLEAFEQAADGAEFVVPSYRPEKVANLRTQFGRIIRRAGLKAWPKPFHNMRSTRQTELEMQFPAHAVCKWLGNSEKVARDHYLQLTDDLYQRAAGPAPAPADASQGGAFLLALDPSFDAESCCQTFTGIQGADVQLDAPQHFTTPDDFLRNIPMTPTGFEPVLPA